MTAVFYRYSADRRGERPRDHLEGFSGFRHADTFAGYAALYQADGNKPPRITHVASMAHARRKFFEVFEVTKSPIADEALRCIQDLYAIEADIDGKSIDHRRAAHQARSKPLLDAFHAWAVVQRRRLSAKGNRAANDLLLLPLMHHSSLRPAGGAAPSAAMGGLREATGQPALRTELRGTGSDHRHRQNCTEAWSAPKLNIAPF